MSVSRPPLCIGLPVHNGEAYLREALDSLLTQTWGDFQLLICDNASSDATGDIARDYAARDRRVIYHRNAENLGAAPNFNRAFELSDTEFFKWTAADDLYAPTYLARCMERLAEAPGAALCHCRTSVIDPRGNRLAPVGESAELYDPPRRLDSASPADRFHDIVLCTKWCFEIFGVMRSAFVRRASGHASYYGSDKVMLAELAFMGPFAMIDEDLFFRRHHPGSSTALKTPQQRNAWMDARRNKRAAFPRLHCLQGYRRSMRFGALGLADRLRCYATLLHYTMQIRKWKKVMLEEPWFLAAMDSGNAGAAPTPNIAPVKLGRHA